MPPRSRWTPPQKLSVLVDLRLADHGQERRDAFGNAATRFEGAVTVTLGSNTAGATLSGTTTVEISDDFKTLVFHALDAGNPPALRAAIDRTLKQPILSFTR